MIVIFSSFRSGLAWILEGNQFL